MGFKAKKMEHSGSKKGRGSYWGRKTDAKKESNRKRREDNKELIREHGSILKEREKAYAAGKLTASNWEQPRNGSKGILGALKPGTKQL